MATVPGTHFTKEQLYADLKVDNITAEERSGSHKLTHFGFVYDTERKKYDKALAWYILAAMENNSTAPSNIGVLYGNGLGVRKNNLCALKWFLKSAEQNSVKALNNIGILFEEGQGVPLDKHKALEWYCHADHKTNRDILKKEGYHRSEAEKKKPLLQLIKETKVILDTQKKKLEEKKNKTREEIETLKQLNITYKLTDGGKNAWKDVPMLLSNDNKPSINMLNELVVSYEDEIQTLKRKIQLRMENKDRELISMRNEIESLHHGQITLKEEIETKDNKISSLERENQELKMKNSHFEHSVKEKDSIIIILQTEKQLFKLEKTTLEQLLKSKEDTIVSLNRENQALSTANQENQKETSEVVETLRNLLQAKTNETELLRQNMEQLLGSEQRRIDALEQENRILKQERTQKQTTVQSTVTFNNNISPSHIGSGQHDHHDDPNNDINYDTEISNDEESEEENDINYDTPSEDENN
ncbi:hypothetical protein K501DRAFT_330963 [Backusella circina FSU 941]|nr:hypothetical protein K501DRAFT_330963 [Backusella circina FSU 941]